MLFTISPHPAGDSTSLMDDSQVIAEFLKTKDPDLFETLVDRHKDKVFRLALSILGPAHPAEAEEVTQEVFLLIYRRLERYRGESRFTTWLYRIAYNRAIDVKRRARYQRPHLGTDELLSMPDPGIRNPLAAAVASEKRRAVLGCLDELPDLYRSVLHLHYWQEYGIEDIAEILGAPLGTIKSYMHRARKRLQDCMRKKGLTHGSELP